MSTERRRDPNPHRERPYDEDAAWDRLKDDPAEYRRRVRRLPIDGGGFAS